MQLTSQYFFIKPRNSLFSVSLLGFIPVITKVVRGNDPYLACRNVSHLLTLSKKGYYQSTNSFSLKNKQFSEAIRSKGVNVQSLWDDEEKEKLSSNNETYDKFQLLDVENEHIRQDQLLFSKLEDQVQNVKNVTKEHWDAIKKSVLEKPGSIDDGNIDAIIIKNCAQLSLHMCKSYFKYLKSTQKILNLAVYGSYLRAFYTYSSSCTDEDLKEIVDIYNELHTIYPILDSYTAEKLVFAICLTAHWKEYEKLFKVIKQCYPPSMSVYSVVIQTAFKNLEIELGWKLIEEMMINHRKVSDEVLLVLLQGSEISRSEDLTRVLDFLSKFNFKPTFEVANVVVETFNNISATGKGSFTTILKSGVCTHCSSKLQQAWVSKKDYDQLKEAFLNPVLIGKDIFLKTQPEEFQQFQLFLENTAPYDIVLDGLNIALKIHRTKKTPKAEAFQLKSVVRHFATQGQKILVLGRKHMERWPAEEWKFIKKNAHVFLAEDISQDDPFLLYATLYSGIGTYFVSQDMMRSHRFLLAEPKLKDTFQTWQAQHQCFLMYIEDNGSVHIKRPVPFMQTIQRNSSGDWHIPFEKKEELRTSSRIDNYHRHWVCLTNHPVQSSERYNHPRQYTSQKRKVWEEKSFKREVPKYKPPKRILH